MRFHPLEITRPWHVQPCCGSVFGNFQLKGHGAEKIGDVANFVQVAGRHTHPVTVASEGAQTEPSGRNPTPPFVATIPNVPAGPYRL
jgi:hypothetical protein